MAFFEKILRRIGSNKTARDIAKKLNLAPSTLSKLSEAASPKKSNEQRLADLEKKVDDLNFKLDLILDYYLSASDAKPAKGALAKRQQANREILFAFDKFCKERGIAYWLDFGTLLGAKRHSGEIPWDDDADVAMLESDFALLSDKIQDFDKNFKTDLSGEIGRISSDCGIMDIFVYAENKGRLKARNFFSKIPHFNFSIPKDIVFPLREVAYCGRMLPSPSDADLYLRARYGNYELLPKHKNAYEHAALKERVIFFPEEDR